MRVIVTRPESEARRWIDELRRRGFEVDALPLMAIAAAPHPAALHAAWQKLPGSRAAMFVSGNAARQFFAHRPAGIPWPLTTRAWATGPGTREALVDAGVPPASVDAPPASAPQFDSETLWHQVAGQVAPGDRVLIVRGGAPDGASSGRDWLADTLQAAGAQVELVVAYVRQAPQWDATQLQLARQAAGAGHVWLFSSSQAIGHLRTLLPREDWSRAGAIATHTRIAQAARHAGFGVVCESRPAVDAVVAALESFR